MSDAGKYLSSGASQPAAANSGGQTVPLQLKISTLESFAANIVTDVALLAPGGSIAAYATDAATPDIPFWPLVFKNTRVFFLGSDDFPADAKAAAARDLNDALEAGWPGFDVVERIPLSDIVRAHEHVERSASRGRVVVVL